MTTEESESDDAPAASCRFRYRFGQVEFDESKASLLVDGRAVPLEPKPLRLLALLLEHVNEVVSRDELHEAIWDGRPTVDNVIPNAITKLRRALGDNAGKRIVTLPRIGYRFDGPIDRIAVTSTDRTGSAFSSGDAVPLRSSYRLTRPLGNPARGNVWLAQHSKLGTTRVFKFAATTDELRGLKREFTLCRLLRLELGVSAGLAVVTDFNFAVPPFFLEYEYGGVDLATWAADGDRLNNTSVAGRLDVVLQIVRAVASAHSVGVLHKDIKPSNVLIDGDAAAWKAKLTDFGSGRATDPDRLRKLGLTAMGLTVTALADTDSSSGTPLYLAPELLAGGPPTTQSDVYALGLLLYQLLCGDLRRPLSSGWQHDIDDPLLVDDISAATQGRPERRLGSARELQERLETLEARRARHARAAELEHQALQTRLELERRRSRQPWVWSSFVSLSLGLLMAVWYYRDAQLALKRSDEERTRATVIADFLNQDVLASTDIIRLGASRPVTMIEVLRSASRRASERFKADPLTEASVRRHLAQMFWRLSSTNDGTREYATAISILNKQLSPGDPRLIVTQLENVCLLFEAPNRVAEAKASLLQLASQSNLESFRGDLVEFTYMRAKALLAIADSDLVTALAAADHMNRISDFVDTIDPANRQEAIRLQAEIHMQMGDQEQADQVLDTLIEQGVNRQQIGAITFARVSDRVAAAHVAAKRLNEAETTLKAALLRLAEPAARSELHVGYLSNSLGILYDSQGKFPQALDAYQAAYDSLAVALGSEHQFTRVAAMNIAGPMIELGRYAEAVRLISEHRPWFQVHAKNGRWLPLEIALGRALIGLGRLSDAKDILSGIPDPPVEGFESASDSNIWYASGVKGVVLILTGNVGRGRAIIERALSVLTGSDFDPRKRLYLESELLSTLKHP